MHTHTHTPVQTQRWYLPAVSNSSTFLFSSIVPWSLSLSASDRKMHPLSLVCAKLHIVYVCVYVSLHDNKKTAHIRLVVWFFNRKSKNIHTENHWTYSTSVWYELQEEKQSVQVVLRAIKNKEGVGPIVFLQSSTRVQVSLMGNSYGVLIYSLWHADPHVHTHVNTHTHRCISQCNPQTCPDLFFRFLSITFKKKRVSSGWCDANWLKPTVYKALRSLSSLFHRSHICNRMCDAISRIKSFSKAANITDQYCHKTQCRQSLPISKAGVTLIQEWVLYQLPSAYSVSVLDKNTGTLTDCGCHNGHRRGDRHWVWSLTAHTEVCFDPTVTEQNRQRWLRIYSRWINRK